MIKKIIFSLLLSSLLLWVNGCKHDSDSNEPPISDAGIDQTTQVGNEVILEGSASHDPDGDQINYRWSIRSAPEGHNATLSATNVISPTLIPDIAGVYVIELVVNDGETDSPVDIVVMTVDSTSNQPPIANAGVNKMAQVGNQVTLDGSGSHDPDGDEITYQWITPTGITLSNTNEKKPTFIISNEITPSTLVFNLKVIDSKGETSDLDSVEIIVVPHNDPPVAKARTNPVPVTVGQAIMLNGHESFDINDDSLTYLWSIKTAPAGNTATLSDINAISPTFIPHLEGTYLFDLMVNDGQENSTIDKVMVTVIPDRPPIADAGIDQTIQVGNKITLDGSASHDPDGNDISYRWSVRRAPEGHNANLLASDTISPSLIPDIAGVYVIELLVNDGQTDSPVDIVVITVSSKPNQSPVANAGIDKTVEVSKEIILDGSASIDPDGDAITYQWSVRRAPEGNNATLSATNVISPTLVPEIAGVYVIELVVNDGQTDSPVDIVVITVKSSQLPIANAGIDQTVPVANEVTLDGSGSKDPDGDAITYQWSIDSAPEGHNATLSATNIISPTLIPDIAGDYVIELVVNDGQTDSSVDSVVITAKSSQLPIANAGVDQTVQVAREVTLDGSASHDPDGDAISYQWSIHSAPDDNTATLSATNVISPTIIPDIAGDYVIELVVNDGQTDSSVDSVVITVKSNQLPIANAGIDQIVETGIEVILDGSASYDPDGDEITYLWTAPAGVILSSTTTDKPTFTTTESEGPLIFTLTVTDSHGITSDPDNIEVSFKSASQPIAKIHHTDQTRIAINRPITLDGSHSYSPDDKELTYQWSISQSPEGNTATLSDTNAITPSFTPNVIGDYTITLIVNDGNLDSEHEDISIRVKATVVHEIKTTLSSGDNHNCMIDEDDRLWCWGKNDFGQLGDGTTDNKSIRTKISTSDDWSQISLGEDHSCAIKLDGSLWCWGDNSSSQLGDGTTEKKFIPTPIGSDTDWTQISLGTNHSCAIKADGSLWCWGKNSLGQLGDATNQDSLIPIPIGTDTDWAQISIGNNHSCGLKLEGTLWCWGNNEYGQLGDGTNNNASTPVQISTDIYWTLISLGGEHSCGLKTFGTLWCWGDNSSGQLGEGTTDDKSIPTLIGADTHWKKIILGKNHSCGVNKFRNYLNTIERSLWCWGNNNFGQIDDETRINKLKPTEVGNETLSTSSLPVISLYGESQISLGGNYSCGINRSGDPFCWGDNSDDQLDTINGEYDGYEDLIPYIFSIPEMLTIPSGNFLMGDETSPDGNTQGEGGDDEVPSHTVVIDTFNIGKYEVTVGQFRQFVDATNYVTDAENNDGDVNGCWTYDGSGSLDWQSGTSWKNPNFTQTESDPVVCVSWNDVQAYIKWLNEQTELNYRLPSEAEWEYSARAETVTKYSFGDNDSNLCTYGNAADQTAAGRFTNWTNIAECSDGYIFTSSVGQFSANDFGLYDMHGNAGEWVEDCWHDNYTGAPSDGSGWTTDCANDTYRVYRGGAWNSTPWDTRASNRSWASTNFRGHHIGFRLAQTHRFSTYGDDLHLLDEEGIFDKVD